MGHTNVNTFQNSLNCTLEMCAFKYVHVILEMCAFKYVHVKYVHVIKGRIKNSTFYIFAFSNISIMNIHYFKNKK